MGEHVIIRVKIKELLDELGDYKMAADFIDKLDEKVRLLIEEAIKRAEANGRHTVMAKDI